MKKVAFLVILITVVTIMLNSFFSNNRVSNTQSSIDKFAEAKEEFSALEAKENLQRAGFAGGCFWCMEGPLESIEGVEGVILGYTGGNVENPTYEQVSSGMTGHREVALAFYDPKVTQYRDLVDMYWKFIDPVDAGGQFADRGSQYRISIYYYTPEQKQIADDYIEEKRASGKYDKPIVVEVLPATDFYLAEDDHQNYYKKQSKNYKGYYKGSGRQDYVESNK